MSNELIKRIIKRIDERIDFWKEGEPSTSPIVNLLTDCRAEIKRLSKPYVPMTDDEWDKLEHSLLDEDWPYGKSVERAVIKRYREQMEVSDER